jgi:hypothetical protein
MTGHTVAILQPGYLPWLGFFEQMYRSQTFVVYDDVQYDKHGWRNRNRIKTAQGWQWLTVPVLTSGQNKPTNKEVRIDNSTDWRIKHSTSIRQHYSRAKYFDVYFPALEAVYQREWKYLIDLDMVLIRQIADWLGLQRDLRFASELNISGGQTERLVSICVHLGADTFYEGAAGKNYIDASLFEASQIKLMYQNYDHPVYDQLYGDFVPYMSIIDLLFNQGELSLDILTHWHRATLKTEHTTTQKEGHS